MTLVRLALIREKLRQIRENADLLRACLPADAAGLADRDVLHLVSFRVYLVLQGAVDVASHVIAARGVVDSSVASSLADAIKVRNLIGHAYARVDPVRLLEAARELLRAGRDDRYSELRSSETPGGAGRVEMSYIGG